MPQSLPCLHRWWPLQGKPPFATQLMSNLFMLHGIIIVIQGMILTAETTSLMRPVQHHYDDRRAASEGGTCFKYKLFHKTTSGVLCSDAS